MGNGWTSERRARQAALIQRWKPWERSTGPKTPEGKARASRNAFKDGWRAQLRELSRLLREQDRTLRGSLTSPISGDFQEYIAEPMDCRNQRAKAEQRPMILGRRRPAKNR
jgi:hypothetical protein